MEFLKHFLYDRYYCSIFILLAVVIRLAIGQRGYYNHRSSRYSTEGFLFVLEFLLKWFSNLFILLIIVLLLAEWINRSW